LNKRDSYRLESNGPNTTYEASPLEKNNTSTKNIASPSSNRSNKRRGLSPTTKETFRRKKRKLETKKLKGKKVIKDNKRISLDDIDILKANN
jgi:hypothetical protein